MLKLNSFTACVAIMLLWLVLVPASARAANDFIDFETLPDGTPTTDQMAITTQYSFPPFPATYTGVTFSLSNGNDPRIAKVGSPLTAFTGPQNTKDTICWDVITRDDMPRTEDQGIVGCSFLTRDNIGSLPPDQIVDYDSPVTEAGGYLLDIDGPEKWEITAYLNSLPVGTPVILDASSAGGQDGVATLWIMEVAAPGFDRLVFHYADATPRNVGLAFDGFYTSSIPPSGDISIDIKPGSCPNPLNVHMYGKDPWQMDELGNMAAKAGPRRPERPKAVLPVAILGSDDFDVTDIDPSTVTLQGVPALRWNVEDVSTPVSDTTECACDTLRDDGFADLTLKFERDAIITALGEVFDGDVIPLTITGELTDGTPFEGTDCVLIRGNSGSFADRFGGDQSLPGQFSLVNYPNPFNPVTQISFTLANPENVRLEVLNLLGQSIATLVDGYREAGHHTIEFDGSNVASGVYFYRLTSGDIEETRKMMLLK